MPDVDGFEAARRIRDFERAHARARLPIVALTAHVIGTTANAWRDADMDDVVYKPYTLAQLRACFQRLLPDWSVDGSAIAPDAAAEGDAVDVHTRDDLLDPAIFRELREIDGPASDAFVRRVFGLYVEHAPRTRDEIVAAWREQDRDVCARAAHALKSMSQNIGARQVAASVAAIERCARETGIPQADHIAALNRLLDATIAEIGAKLAQIAGDQVPGAKSVAR